MNKSSNSAAETKQHSEGVIGSYKKKIKEERICAKLLCVAKAGVTLHGATDLISLSIPYS